MEQDRKHYLWKQNYAMLLSAANKVQSKGDEAQEHMTSRQLMLLLAINYLEDGTATMTKVADMIGATKQSVKQLIDLLKAKGYLEAKRSVQDARALELVLTEQGKEAMAMDYQSGMAVLGEFFGDFEVEELETLRKFLIRMYQFDGEDQNKYEWIAIP